MLPTVKSHATVVSKEDVRQSLMKLVFLFMSKVFNLHMNSLIYVWDKCLRIPTGHAE